MLPLASRRIRILKRLFLVSACTVASSFLVLHIRTSSQAFSSGRQNVPALEFEQRERVVYDRLLACVHAIKKANRHGRPGIGRALACLQEELESYGNKPSGGVKNPISEFMKFPVINHFNYNYSINRERECENSKTDLLFVVPSAPSNFVRRSYVRQSKRWKYTKTHSNVSLLFFIGTPFDDTDGVIQNRIENESRIYNDIIQVNFFDLYENIRLKSISILKWITVWCSEVTYIIRTDDDIMVNMTELIDVMRKVHKNYTDFIIGKKRVGDSPARVYNKYHLSYAEYPESTFPPYVLGGLIGYPVSTVQLLYQAALRLKSIWLDDVFITGICAARMEIPVLEDPMFKFKHIS